MKLLTPRSRTALPTCPHAVSKLEPPEAMHAARLSLVKDQPAE
jgi:hypothetical protein